MPLVYLHVPSCALTLVFPLSFAGFGYLGHATNLAVHQKAKVDIELHVLPIIAGIRKVDQCLGGSFRLLQGFSAETSGTMHILFVRVCVCGVCGVCV